MIRKIKFKSITNGSIDTTTANGILIFNIFASLAQFERDLIRERTLAGLSAARARGMQGGRPSMNPDDPKIITGKKLHADKTISIDDICKTLNIEASVNTKDIIGGTAKKQVVFQIKKWEKILN